MLAAFFNMQSGFYYELFSNFMGKGDKESFAFAFAATNTPYYKVPHPVGSVGQMRSYCRCAVTSPFSQRSPERLDASPDRLLVQALE